jgi:hypothetical protein
LSGGGGGENESFLFSLAPFMSLPKCNQAKWETFSSRSPPRGEINEVKQRKKESFRHGVH